MFSASRPFTGGRSRRNPNNGRGKVDELVISYELWQRMFVGDPGVIGRSVNLVSGEDPFVIAGVMPRGFHFDATVDAWRPMAVQLPISRGVRSMRFDRVIARLCAGHSIDQLRAELTVTSALLAREFPASNAGWSATVEPLLDSIVGRFGRGSWLLLAAIAAVLLAACANIAGLLNARLVARTRETGVRLALGAGRWQVGKMWLSEALTLAAVGATLGVVMAWWLAYGLRAAAPAGLPRVEDIAVDVPALAFAVTETFVTALGCALIPLMNVRTDALLESLKSGSAHSGSHPRPLRVSAALVAAQSAAALALVVASIVFARSFLNLIAVEMGWRPARVLSLHLAPRWPQDVRRPWFLYATWVERLVARLEAAPGVARAAVTTIVPFSPDAVPAEIARGREQLPTKHAGLSPFTASPRAISKRWDSRYGVDGCLRRATDSTSRRSPRAPSQALARRS